MKFNNSIKYKALINMDKKRRTISFSCLWNEFAPQLPYWLIKAKQREERLRDGGRGRWS
jgi:hypothetical protein